MKKLIDYDHNEYVGAVSLSGEVSDALIEKGLNPILISDGIITLVRENLSFRANDELASYLDSVKEFDVIEINPSGRFNHTISQDADDATLFVTEKCNSNCIMCPYSESIRKNGWLTDGSETIEIARHMPADLKHVTITGGEPFMIRENLFRVLQIIREKFREQEVLLLTNGRIFCLDSYVEQLEKSAPENLLLGIPLHSNDEEMHDRISQTPGSFMQTASGISKLINHDFNVEIRVVVNKINYTNLQEIASYIRDNFPKAYRVVFMGMEMMGSAAVNKGEVWIPYRESSPFITKAVDILISAGITAKIYNYPLCTVDRKYWDACDLSISDYKRTYSEVCRECLLKNNCAGLFEATYLLEKDELKAVVTYND